MLIKNSIGVSLASISDGIGILRSFVLDLNEVVNDEFVKFAKEFYAKNFKDDIFIGIEDVFHVSIPNDDSSRPIYGKSYIEPLQNGPDDLILNSTDLNEILHSKKDKNVIASMLFYSESDELAITCLTPLDLSLSNVLCEKGLIDLSEFETNEFKLKFVNFKFDGITPEDLTLYGLEAIYSFEKRVFGNWLQTVVLSNDEISKQEMNEMILADGEIMESVFECQEWIESINAI